MYTCTFVEVVCGGDPAANDIGGSTAFGGYRRRFCEHCAHSFSCPSGHHWRASTSLPVIVES